MDSNVRVLESGTRKNLEQRVELREANASD